MVLERSDFEGTLPLAVVTESHTAEASTSWKGKETNSLSDSPKGMQY